MIPDLSPHAMEVLARLRAFMDSQVVPAEAAVDAALAADRWRPVPLVEDLKVKARDQGLWNLFLPERRFGAGLSNREYAACAEVMGRIWWASEVFHCSAPDTGNMEVLVRYGSAEQQQQWLRPLLDGTIRSCFAMTEPAVASSDATNMKATCEVVGDEIVINGQKWWTSGAGDPRCKFLIFMGVTDPHAERHQRHSMVIVPIDARGPGRREDVWDEVGGKQKRSA